MKRRAFNLFILLTILLGMTACSQEAAPTPTANVGQQRPTVTPTPVVTQPEAAPPSTQTEVATEPTATEVVTEQTPTAAPTEAAPQSTATPATKPGHFSRDELIEDARQLAHILESVHPDPYINGGGMIAFHHRLQRLLNAIPEEGMTKEEFTRLLIPFVASVGDGHTVLHDEYSGSVNSSSPGGVPFRLRVVGESLYVAGVPHGIDTSLLGSLLISVEGIPVAELCKWQGRIEGSDNQYHGLQMLAEASLYYEPYMQDLIPEWKDTSHVTVELQRPTGEIETLTFDLPMSVHPQHTSESQVTLPSTGSSGFTYELLDEEGQLAYLRVDNLEHYAEGNEAGTGSSAIEMFREMVAEMKEAETETLIVDLRINEGGSSAMGDILVYFLYGKDVLQSLILRMAEQGECVPRYSEMRIEAFEDGVVPEKVDQTTFVVGDYYFNPDFLPLQEGHQETSGSSELLSRIEQSRYAYSPTWYEEYQSETYSGYYLPENVLVLVTTQTYSAGAIMMRYLSQAGAVLVGTPSSQSTNFFCGQIPFRLDNTFIRGGVSTQYCIFVPPDSDAARVWPVDYPLTYETLAAYDFDPNAEYLYALELLPELGE